LTTEEAINSGRRIVATPAHVELRSACEMGAFTIGLAIAPERVGQNAVDGASQRPAQGMARDKLKPTVKKPHRSINTTWLLG